MSKIDNSQKSVAASAQREVIVNIMHYRNDFILVKKNENEYIKWKLTKEVVKKQINNTQISKPIFEGNYIGTVNIDIKPTAEF